MGLSASHVMRGGREDRTAAFYNMKTLQRSLTRREFLRESTVLTGALLTAPGAARGGINEPEYNCSVRDDANVFGPLAVGVPGVMAGIGLLWERWGNLRWQQIVAPSLELLERGFPYGPTATQVRRMEVWIRKYEP